MSSHEPGPPQIDGQREFGGSLLGWHIERARRVAMVLKSMAAARFRLKTVDQESFIVASARMRGMVNAAA
jgi:hypothetical protein